jgi:hypothetical protein
MNMIIVMMIKRVIITIVVVVVIIMWRESFYTPLIRRVLVWIIGFITHSNHIYIQPHSTVVDLRTLEFTVAHALGFYLSTSRLLATDLNAETITSNHWITHKRSLQITRSGLLQLRNFNGYLPPRSNCKRTSVSPINARSDTRKNTASSTVADVTCCGCVTSLTNAVVMSPLSTLAHSKRLQLSPSNGESVYLSSAQQRSRRDSHGTENTAFISRCVIAVFIETLLINSLSKSVTIIIINNNCVIWGSHSCDYEDDCLLTCAAV